MASGVDSCGIVRTERTWAMLCHVAAFAGFIIPFGGLVGPLVLWLIKKDDMPFVNHQGREALNFQITVFVGFLIGVMLFFLSVGSLFLLILVVFNAISIVIATVKANDGVWYRYPLSFRFIK